MTKKKLNEIKEKYGMQTLRNSITGEDFGLRLRTEDLIPELDAIVENPERNPVVGQRFYDPFGYEYFVYAPRDWFA